MFLRIKDSLISVDKIQEVRITEFTPWGQQLTMPYFVEVKCDEAIVVAGIYESRKDAEQELNRIQHILNESTNK